MKIIYISPGNIPSKWAHTFQAMRMAEAFAKKTDRFCLLTGGSIINNRSDFDINEWYGIQRPFKIRKLPVFKNLRDPLIGGYRYPRFDKAAAVYSRVASPDLVFTRSIYAGCLCARLGLRTIIETHAQEDHPDFSRLLNEKRLKGIVTITEELKRLYIDAGIAEEKIFVWPDAVNLEAYAALGSKEQLRVKFNLPADQFIAVYAGHLYAHKGVDVIMAAARQLPEVHFLIVGGWEKDIEAFQNKSQEMKLNNIRWVGFVPNKLVPEYLAVADVLLMPNSAKSPGSWMSPLKLFEYMAAQRPIISSDLPALRPYLADGHNAVLIKPDDAQALREAINRVRLKEVKTETMVQNAYKDAQRHTWDNRVAKIMEYFFGEN